MELHPLFFVLNMLRRSLSNISTGNAARFICTQYSNKNNKSLNSTLYKGTLMNVNDRNSSLHYIQKR